MKKVSKNFTKAISSSLGFCYKLKKLISFFFINFLWNGFGSCRKRGFRYLNCLDICDHILLRIFCVFEFKSMNINSHYANATLGRRQMRSASAFLLRRIKKKLGTFFLLLSPTSQYKLPSLKLMEHTLVNTRRSNKKSLLSML